MEGLLNAYQIDQVTTASIAVMMALSLNWISGFCGQVSLGHAAFMGIGAYTAAMLSKAGVGFLEGAIAGMALAGFVGFLTGLTSLRVRHDFLAITTMGVVFLFVGIVNQQEWLGAEEGIAGFSNTGISKFWFMTLTIGAAVAVVLFTIYLRRSWLGKAFGSIADDEDTARIVGIDVPRYKLVAFVMGTVVAGLAGSFYAHQFNIIMAPDFGFVQSITYLSIVVVGGIGSVTGVVLAAIVLTLLPLWFQFIGDYKLLVYGGLLFLMMRFAPEGLAGLARKSLEIWRRTGKTKPAGRKGAPT